MPFKRLVSPFLLVACIAGAEADTLHQGGLETPSFVAQIQAHTPQELSSILSRLEGLLSSESNYPTSQPVALVLHGDEAFAFTQKNYSENKSLVDLAARLDAFNVVDIQICETWMKSESVRRDELPAFVDTVPYGPDKEQSLLEQGYSYF